MLSAVYESLEQISGLFYQANYRQSDLQLRLRVHLVEFLEHGSEHLIT